MKEKLKQTKGITLIALVISIIVLLILAGVSISMLTGENGLISQALKARLETQIAEEKEEILLAYNGVLMTEDAVTADNLDKELEKNGTKAEARDEDSIIVEFESERKYLIDDGNITGPLEGNPEQTPEPEDGGNWFSTTVGLVEIKWLVENTNYTSDIPNKPATKENMELVSYNTETKNWVIDNTSAAYNYNSSRWANAKVTVDGIESYFVWIPRFSYRIVYFMNQEDKTTYINDKSRTDLIIGYSDSRGIVDKDGKKIGGIESSTSINVGDYYMPHPAFTSDASEGGWSTSISGIWVGKYETSLVSTTNNSNIVTIAENGNVLLKDSSSDIAMAVQPNMSSWRYITIGNMYENSQTYSENLNSHMLKNSEWGAVAYLTDSMYGRNGIEISKNDNSNFITADGDIEANANQSTTGNVYGVYDMSGGANEYLAAYYSGSTDSNLTTLGTQLLNETKPGYVTAYTGDAATYEQNNADQCNYINGDATAETKWWNEDYNEFVSNTKPFFKRGGNYLDGDNSAGVFYYSSDTGERWAGDLGFRLCLITK